MLTVNNLTGFGFTKSTPVDINYISRAKSTSNSNDYTFSGQNIGTAFPGRHIVVATVQSAGDGATPALSINGTPMTLLAQGDDNGDKLGVFIMPWPTGTTADFELTGGSNWDRASISVYAADNVKNPVLYDSGYDGSLSGSTTLTANLDIPVGGACVAIVFSDDNQNVSWSGVTEDYDDDYGGENRKFSGGSAVFLNGSNNQAVTTVFASSVTNGRLLAVSFR